MAVSLPDSEEELLAQGVAEVVATLRLYGLPEAKDWQVLPGYANLPLADRTRLDDQLVELAYLAARGEVIIARLSNDKPTAKGHLERALRFNDIARECLNTAGLPHAVVLQCNDLLTKLGHSREVLSYAPERESTPIDDYLDAQADLVAGDYASAEPRLESLRTRHPTDPVVWLLLGNVKAALGHLAEAEGCYTVAVSLQPGSYVAIYNRALCRTQFKAFEGAFDDFARVLVLKPELPCVLLNRALAYEASGDLSQALADLDAAIARGSVPPRAYLIRSRIRARLGDANGAEADRLRGLQEEPRDEVGWVARGVARLADDPEGALDDFRKASALNSRSRLALKNIVHVTADRLNRRDEAMDALNSLLRIDPSNASALIGRAVLKGRLGLRDDALADLDAALQTTQEPVILYQAACTLSLTSRPENHDGARGLLMLSRAIELDPRLLRRAETDPDLVALRSMPDYSEIIASTRELYHLRQNLIRSDGKPDH
jgi:tetratricopeptide (TPR) repeat protein